MPELSPEERRRIYEEEKARLEAPASVESEFKIRQTTATRFWGSFGGVCLALVGIFIVLVIIGSLMPDTPTGKAKPARTQAEILEEMRRDCPSLRAMYRDKPVSALTIRELDLLKLCAAAGY
jgi:hypothetical protein